MTPWPSSPFPTNKRYGVKVRLRENAHIQKDAYEATSWAAVLNVSALRGSATGSKRIVEPSD